VRARITGSDGPEAVAAARALAKFEWLCATVEPDEAEIDAELTPEFSLTYSRIVCHYMMDDFFLEPDQLVRELHRLGTMPGVIVQGARDWVCPPWSAVRLHRAWRGSRLTLVQREGHSSSEPGIAEALLAAMEELKSIEAG
jgi:proline iminopeptidase